MIPCNCHSIRLNFNSLFCPYSRVTRVGLRLQLHRSMAGSQGRKCARAIENPRLIPTQIHRIFKPMYFTSRLNYINL